MLEVILYVAGAVLLIAAGVMGVAAFLAYLRAKHDHQTIEWVTQQLDRALVQISSSDDDSILAGLQTICALNNSSLRLKALPRLAELVQDSNSSVNKYARITIRKISTGPGGHADEDS